MKKIAITSATVLPLMTFAHGGHGVVDQGISHYLLSPLHLIGILAVAVLSYAAYKILKKRHA